MEVELHMFSFSRPTALPLRKEPRYPSDKRVGGSRHAPLVLIRKTLPCAGSNPILKSAAQSLYWPSWGLKINYLLVTLVSRKLLKGRVYTNGSFDIRLGVTSSSRMCVISFSWRPILFLTNLIFLGTGLQFTEKRGHVLNNILLPFSSHMHKAQFIWIKHFPK